VISSSKTKNHEINYSIKYRQPLVIRDLLDTIRFAWNGTLHCVSLEKFEKFTGKFGNFNPTVAISRKVFPLIHSYEMQNLIGADARAHAHTNIYIYTHILIMYIMKLNPSTRIGWKYNWSTV